MLSDEEQESRIQDAYARGRKDAEDPARLAEMARLMLQVDVLKSQLRSQAWLRSQLFMLKQTAAAVAADAAHVARDVAHIADRFGKEER